MVLIWLQLKVLIMLSIKMLVLVRNRWCLSR